MQDNTPAASAARELKAAARDALRMGSQWAHTALHWIDERSTDMSNRSREQEQRERAQRNRYSASDYGADEGDRDFSQQNASQRDTPRASGQAGVLGGRQGRDRDIQHDTWRQGQRGREGSYPQASASPDDFSQRGDLARGGRESGGYAGYGGYAGQSTQSRNTQGRSQGYGNYPSSAGYGAGSEGYDDQDFSQDYSQGSSHYGSQGFGAQGSQGVYGPQGFGSQGGIGPRGSEYGFGSGYSSSGGYSREGYGASQFGQGGSSDQWRARDVSGQGLGTSGSYRGMGPKNYTRSDERIREDLNEKLTDAHDIDASGLSVEVNNGVATLTGSVDQRWMKHRAEDLAESCSGVRDVNNQIRVAAPQSGQQAGSQRDASARGSASSSGYGNAGGASSHTASNGIGGGQGLSGTAQSSSAPSASAQSGTSSATGNTGTSGNGGSSSASTTNTNRPGGSSLS